MLLVPFVSATISIDNNLSQQKFNLGDKITISGSVVINNDLKGFLSYNLACENIDRQLLIQSVSLESNKKYEFSQNLLLLNGEGICHINTILNDLNDVRIDDRNSDSFTISKELEADFNIGDQKLKLGESLNITGTIFKLNGANVNGRATITLNLNSNPYLIDNKDIINGDFSYTNTLSSLPAGSYTVDVYIRDLDGNEKLFENATSFSINNNLNINAAASALEAKPGDKLTVEGEMRDFDDNLISNNINAYVEVNGEDKYQITLKDGKFSNEIKLKTDTKSGPNKIRIFAEDEFGNVGEKVFFVDVKYIPTKLELKATKLDNNPGEEVYLQVILYDQANDEIKSEKANLEVKDSDKDRIIKDTVTTGGEAFKLSLDNYAKPGVWTAKADSNKLESSLTFNVNEVESLSVNINDQILTVLNNGNVKFNNDIEIDFSGYKVEKAVDLKPKETTEINLAKGIEDGTYHLTVSTTNKQFDLGNLTIINQGFSLNELTGAFLGSGSSSWIWIIILAIVILALLLYFLRLKKRPRFKEQISSRERGYKEAQEKMRRLKEEKEMAKKKGRRLFSSTPIKDEDVKEFRESVLKTIKQDEHDKGRGIFNRKE